MLKDVTLGQYYQTDSWMHRLDPRVKLLGTLSYIIILFVVNSVPGYLVCGAFLLVCVLLSIVP
ncbi:MAG: CbiQ family ECF transporter T component, partial [Lachnospiraceae bacterium]|nr:CbiQ family ECF transporter T component [Lachnospiraceae bacterium]